MSEREFLIRSLFVTAVALLVLVIQVRRARARRTAATDDHS